MRFHLDCLKYDLESELIEEESLDYAEHSLPPISDQAEISPSFVSFLSNMNENSNFNIQIAHNEESPQSLGVIHTLIQEDKSKDDGGKPAFDTRSDDLVASQQMQTPRLEQQTIFLLGSISTQRYDLKPDVYVESDE